MNKIIKISVFAFILSMLFSMSNANGDHEDQYWQCLAACKVEMNSPLDYEAQECISKCNSMYLHKS